MRGIPAQGLTRRAALRAAAATALTWTGRAPIGAAAATLVGRRVPLTVFVLGAGGPRTSPSQSDVLTEAAGEVVSGYGSGSVRVVDDAAISDQLQAAAIASSGGRPYTA